MKDRYDELEEYVESLASFELPPYKDLPGIGLYMEQVTDYVRDVFAPINKGGEPLLTSFMVNNYVKARIISEPEKKRYSKEHIGYLLAISTLKKTLSMSEIAMLIELDSELSKDKSVLYGFFRSMSADIMKESASRLASRLKRFKEGIDASDEKALRDRAALLALRASIEATAHKMLASLLLSYVAEEKGESPLKKNRKLEKGMARLDVDAAKELREKKDAALKMKKKDAKKRQKKEEGE